MAELPLRKARQASLSVGSIFGDNRSATARWTTRSRTVGTTSARSEAARNAGRILSTGSGR
jgi:hypothetical protein